MAILSGFQGSGCSRVKPQGEGYARYWSLSGELSANQRPGAILQVPSSGPDMLQIGSFNQQLREVPAKRA